MDLNSLSLKQFRDLFVSLPVPDMASIRGVYSATFVGPSWLRASAGPALALSGLGGWWGKEFSADGTAVNIVLRTGKFSTRFPMKLIKAKSCIDGREGLAVQYQAGNPFPWMYIVDELRQMNDATLLGMTLANVNGLRNLAFPFTLQFQEHGYGL